MARLIFQKLSTTTRGTSSDLASVSVSGSGSTSIRTTTRHLIQLVTGYHTGSLPFNRQFQRDNGFPGERQDEGISNGSIALVIDMHDPIQ